MFGMTMVMVTKKDLQTLVDARAIVGWVAGRDSEPRTKEVNEELTNLRDRFNTALGEVKL